MTNVQADLLDDLRGVLREATGHPDLDFAQPPTPLTGGFWARLLSFELVGAPAGWDGRLVARVMPEPTTAAKETAVQRTVAAQGFPTPTVHAAGGPTPGIDGQAYLVMDHAAGEPMLAGLDGITALRQLPSLARRLPATLASVTADLHRVDPGPVIGALDAGGVPQPTVPSMLATLQETAAALGRSDLVDAIDWLSAHPPADEPVVLCHGDLHPFNVLVAPDGSVTVLDWSAAILASPTYDVGFTSLLLAEPPLPGPRPLRAIVRFAGKRLSRRFLRAYERAAGATVDDDVLGWYHGLIAARALLEVATWAEAGTVGARSGHPWVIASDALAARLRELTGVHVEPR